MDDFDEPIKRYFKLGYTHAELPANVSSNHYIIMSFR